MTGGDGRAAAPQVDVPFSNLTCFLATSVRRIDNRRQGLTIYTNLLAGFLANKAHRAFVVEQPFALDGNLTPRLEEYAHGRLVRKMSFPVPAAISRKITDSARFSYALRLRDMLSTFYFMLASKGTIDVFVGIESANFLVGLLFKRVRKVRLVVYSVLDYWPQRFPSRLTNALFHVLDKYSVRNADVVWNTSEEARRLRERLWRRTFSTRQVTVPSLNPPYEWANYGPRSGNSVAYVGSLDEKWGLYLAIDAVEEVSHEIPDVALHLSLSELLDFRRLQVGHFLCVHHGHGEYNHVTSTRIP